MIIKGFNIDNYWPKIANYNFPKFKSEVQLFENLLK